MVNENSTVDLEAGNPSPQGPADETIFDFEHCSDLDGEKRAPRGGLIACSIFTCTVLSIIAVLIWAVVTSIPKADSKGSVEPAAAAKCNLSTNISDSTPTMMVASGLGNNSAPNSMLSFTGTANYTAFSSSEARSFPPTRYCGANGDCDWGHVCSDGICQPGCDSQDDCRPGHRCKEGLCYRRAYCFPRKCEKECSKHFYICKKNRECCSGMCMRSTRDKRFKVCQIGTRRGRREGVDSVEQEEEGEQAE